ncbi:MAG: sugar phosphate isomerase/epimerase [Anaerolineae bacterium]|nr:sugar phosphate isomerase/epimerase [Anaerolineae bacterium]
MKLSLSTGSLYVYPLRTVLRMARETGFDGVEIGVNPEVIARGGRAVRQLVEAEGLALFSVHPTVVPLPGWREKHGGLDRTIRLAQDAGAQVVVAHTPRSETLDEGKGLIFCRQIEAWQARLAGGSLRLAIENKAIHHKAEWRYALTPLGRLRAFADRYDLGLVLDAVHAGSAGEDLVRARQIFGSRLVNVHLSDLGGQRLFHSVRPLRKFLEQHRFPGSGSLPLAGLLVDLQRSGYAGPVTLEVGPIDLQVWWPPAARRRLAQAMAWMKDALASR